MEIASFLGIAVVSAPPSEDLADRPTLAVLWSRGVGIVGVIAVLPLLKAGSCGHATQLWTMREIPGICQSCAAVPARKNTLDMGRCLGSRGPPRGCWYILFHSAPSI